MNRRSDLATKIVHDLKLPGVVNVRYRYPNVDVKPEHTYASTVHLNVHDLDLHASAYEAIARHDQLEIVDHISEDPGPEDNGTTEYLVVQVKNVMRAQAHINALDLAARINKREVEQGQHAKLAKSTHAMLAERFLSHLIALETEHQLWDEVSKDGDLRRVFSSAVANLCGPKNGGTLLERAVWEAQDNGFRRFIERARTYTTDEDAAEAFLSI